MGLGTIQFGGLASGLDTDLIISTLVSLERRPILLLQREQTTNQNKVNLLGTLEGLVKNLQAKATAMLGEDGSGFFSNLVSSSDEAIATVQTTGDVQAGSYDVEIDSLAERDRYAFKGVPDADAVLTGTMGFSMTYAGEEYGTFGTDLTLNEIAAKINTDMGDAVTATVINAGTDASPSYQLMISANETGEDFAIDFPEVILPSALEPTDALPGVGGPGQVTAASNAVIQVNGLQIERSTNEFSGVIPGLTFNVREAGDGVSVNFNVEVDAGGTKETVEDFITSYNKVMDFLNAQSTYSEDAGPGGDLFGDSALSSVRSALNSSLFNVDIATIQADTTGFSTLSLVGVDLDSDGKLSLDSEKFQEKYEENAGALADLFSGDGGVLERLDAAIDGLVKGPKDENGDYFTYGVDGTTVPGIFDQRRDVLESVNSRITNDIERLERSLEAFETSLTLKYANLETLMAGLNSQSSALSAIQSTNS